ncbi:GPW/gp25 family protein [Paenibacillus allorhizosphaerae]|uniref:IraD/Gp25-like domain-containing protein n=1 Tax=Paenibacillus allorhizosphaerae TaxID=2849866 RepID=A0ABN7TMM3_9BACL|nr:GPW/gp25 family protein [Paenibacillus allorhizosphaerae]CAG7640749.1 hypothetical protein PAECIP111802_02680 [Paenibacillus allorhizosphaerae]
MSSEFLGRGWKFPISVDPSTGKIRMSAYEEDIEEAIRLIIRTSKGERVMRPQFGSGIQQYVFGLTDPTTRQLMESSFAEAILQWEPRVYEVKVTSDLEAIGSGILHLNIRYTVRSTNNLYNLVFPFYLHEGAK